MEEFDCFQCVVVLLMKGEKRKSKRTQWKGTEGILF
jgi:hypothetical protein